MFGCLRLPFTFTLIADQTIVTLRVECDREEVVSFITGERDLLNISQKVSAVKTLSGCDLYIFAPFEEADPKGTGVLITLDDDRCTKFMDGLLSRFGKT